MTFLSHNAVVLSLASILLLAVPVQCTCIPIDVPDTFLFVDGLNGGSNPQDIRTSWIAPQGSTIPSSIPNNAASLRPSCLNDNRPSIDAYPNSGHISYYTYGYSLQSLKVCNSCQGEVMFNIARDAETFTYSVTNTSGSLLAYAPETTVDKTFVLLDGPTKKITLATATHSYSEFPLTTPLQSYPFGESWNVTLYSDELAKLGLDRILVPYLLSIKSNQLMTCAATSAPAAPPAQQSSNVGWVVGVSLLLSIVVAIVVYYLFRRYYRKQDYAQMRVMINENHEV